MDEPQQQHENLLQTIETQGLVPEFERAVLKVCATPGKKGQNYADIICFRDEKTGYFYRDFSAPQRNVLCMCLKQWRQACGESYAIPAPHVISLMVSKLVVEMPDLVTASEIPGILVEWDLVLKDSPLMPIALNEDVAGAWMKKSRFERAVRESHYKLTSGGRKISASSIVERLHAAMAQSDLSGMNVNAKFVSIDDFLRKADTTPSTTFYSTGIPILDRLIGSGYAKSYSYLHVAGTGSGKTVYACQMTVNLSVRQDLFGLYISTEEPENELYGRMLSNFCSIEIDDIRNKLPKGELVMSPVVKAKFDLAVKKLRERVLIKRWVGEDFDLQNDLAIETKEFEQSMGHPPHYIVFDWLGASTTDLANGNGIRHSLKSRCYGMDLFAKKHYTTVLYFMQAGESHAKSRHITQECVDECKTAGVKCPAVLGWSFLKNQGETGQLASNGVHLDNQTFTVGKSRFGRGGFFPVVRKFNVQRFEFPK